MPSLRDAFGRTILNCRISVTDRCNFRCIYCMPANPVWLPRAGVLTFEEIHRVVRILLSTGIRKIRLTGGEPTARPDLPKLVRSLAELPDLEDLSLTTNGLLLPSKARPLWEAGLRRINVSLDTLREEKFVHIARREGLGQVRDGLREARRVGFHPIKVNMVVMRGINDDEVADFARLSKAGEFQIRFIEYMPLDGNGQWSRDQLVTAGEILDRIRADVGPVELVPRGASSDTASLYRFADGSGDFGIIASVSRPFCRSCDRIRLTADGKIRTCLFSQSETDLRSPLRGGASDGEIADMIQEAVWRKEAGHGINDPGFQPPIRAMHSIGG